ncbi:MAG: large subunit ribosomal protein L1 [Patescibacteria group bacterium]|jgi:large subunit ribosomal protein L1
MEFTQAINELKNEKARKFSQSVDLIVNLKNFDVRKEALNTFISVPNPTEKKIGAFLTKPSKLLPTITEADFARYKDTKDIKKLAQEYDLFICVAPMMSKVATKFGRVFGPMGKMPSPQAGVIPQDNDEVIESMMNKMKAMIRIRTKEMSVKLSVGKQDMDDEKLQQNINSVLEQLESKLPRGKDCIKNVMVKLTMTKAIKVIDNTVKKNNGKE